MRNKTVILILILIGLLTYCNSLLNGFLGDDFGQIVTNTTVHSISNIPQLFASSTYENGGSDRIFGLFYRPLMLSIFSIIYSFAGNDPLPYHFIQLILHIANTILLYFFFKKYFTYVISFFVSLIFLIHPINSEAVVYSANLQEVLFVFFGMISLLIVEYKVLNLKRSIFLAILLLLSLLSKETGLLFICIILFYNLLFKMKKLKNVFIISSIVSIIYLFLRYPVAHMEQALGSITPLYNASILEKLINVPAIFIYYLKTFLFPLTFSSHQFWMIKSLNFNNFYLPLFLLIFSAFLIFILGLYIYNYRKTLFKQYLFFITWFLIGIVLHLQIIVPLDMTVADRWFYFPFVGLLGIIALISQQIKIKTDILKKMLFAFCFLLVLLLSFRTFQRNFDWKDELTLFEHDIHTTPKNFILNNLYATALIKNEEFDKAKPMVESSVKEHPFYANLNNMAIIYASEKNYKEAKKYLKKAVSVSQYYVVYENYANFLLTFDDLGEAEKFTRQALTLFPKNPKFHIILAKIYYLKGNKVLGIKQAQEAFNISNNPEDAKILNDIKYAKLENPQKNKNK